jgi:hypothetical protein
MSHEKSGKTAAGAAGRRGRTQASCVWPFGDPKSPAFRFCGAARRPGSPYCDDHHKRAYKVNTKGDDYREAIA